MGVGQQRTDLIGQQRWVQRNVDGAHGEACEIRDGPLPSIFSEDGDPVALADAPAAQRRGHGPDPADQFIGGNGEPGAGLVLHQNGAFAVAPGEREEDIVERV